MQEPCARIDVVVTTQTGNGCVVSDPAGGILARLDDVQTFIWRACDGHTGVAAMVAQADKAGLGSVSVARVFEVLDDLADAGLLVSRAAPPAGMPAMARRRFVTRAAQAAAGVAAVGATLAVAWPEEAKASHREQDNKRYP